MKKLSHFFSLFIIICLVMSSCSKSLYVSNGARDNRPLLFDDEYVIEDLGEINSTGKAFWGIPIKDKKYKKNRIKTSRLPYVLLKMHKALFYIS